MNTDLLYLDGTGVVIKQYIVQGDRYAMNTGKYFDPVELSRYD